MDNLTPFKNSKLVDFPHYLLGKFFTNSTPPSLEETESSLREQWPQILPENMIISTENSDLFFLNFKEMKDKDLFFFKFQEKEDKDFVLFYGPWLVNGVMLIIKELIYSQEIDFTVTELRVSVEGLPFYLHFKTESLSHIEDLLSHEDFEPILIYQQDEYLYFLAMTDLKKPLNPGYFLRENHYVEFKYTNIGDFCYNCGIIGHVKSNCDQESRKERVLNSTSKIPVYGPWSRVYGFPTSFEMVLKYEKEEDLKECEKTLQYRQFFIKINFNEVVVCNSDSLSFTSSSHSFRFPCSYLDFTDLTTSKAREVIESGIDDNAPFPVKDMNRRKRSKLISSVLEEMNEIRKKNSEDKWLTLKLEVNRRHKLTPVSYETVLANREDFRCIGEIERKISELVKKKVEEEYRHLEIVSLWEEDIRDALADIGHFDYPYLFDVTARAVQAIGQADKMMISLITGPKPAEREAVEKLECKKVIGSEIDKLDPCTICSEEMFLGEEVTVLRCSHVFHRLCVHRWFSIGHKCPLCGSELPVRK